MAKTILIKDIDGNICYPKTIKNNIYGLVGELNSIKEAIGITDPVDIMVLFKGTSTPPTDSTYSGFDNIKVGDTYLNTTNSKYYILVAINGPEVGVKAYTWQEIIKSDSIDDYISNVLSTDTQVGASLATNTGFVTSLVNNLFFASAFFTSTGASEAQKNASFGSAIANNQAMFAYWFGSNTHSADGNLYHWLLSSGNYLMDMLFKYGHFNYIPGVYSYFTGQIPWSWFPEYNEDAWSWLKYNLINSLSEYTMLSMWRKGLNSLFNNTSQTFERQMFFDDKHVWCGQTGVVGISGTYISEAKIFDNSTTMYDIANYGNRLFVVMSMFYASASKCSIDLSIPHVPTMHLGIEGFQAHIGLNLRFMVDLLAGFVYGYLWDAQYTSYSVSMVPIFEFNASSVYKLSSIGRGVIKAYDVPASYGHRGDIYVDI